MKESVEIRNAEVARLLTDLTQARLLEPFFDNDITLSDAAKKLTIKLTTLLYHVTKFIRLGLLEVTREESRKGKAIKYYQTTAKAFFVPFDLTPSLSLKHLLTHLDQPSDEIFNREMARTLQDMSSEWGVDISKESELLIMIRRRDRPRKPDTNFNPKGPALVSFTGEFHFDFATAKALQKDLHELLESYEKKQTQGEQLYFYRVGLTPVQDESLEPKD
jgi:hypothetical protein